MSDNLQFQFANDAYYTADDGIYRQYNSTILAIDGVVIDVSDVRFFRFLGPRPQKTILSPSINTLNRVWTFLFQALWYLFID